MKHTKQSIISKDGISYLIPFILITFCFALWGFANDITNPMVKAFSKIFRMSATDGHWYRLPSMEATLQWLSRLPSSSANIPTKQVFC